MCLGGLPTWEIVGLPDASVKESKERIKASIKNTGLKLESRRIVINLSPADTKKEGSIYDLPMAIGILMSNGYIEKADIDKTVIVGEISLDGKINRVNGIFPIALEAMKLGMKRIILPKENAKEAAVVQDIEVIGVSTLAELIEYLNGKRDIDREIINLNNIFDKNTKYKIDFSSVKGQKNVKRALEVAAAGGHNCLLIRTSSERGKTMMAKCIPSILPDLSIEEALETTKIYSVAGLLKTNEPVITKRVFRSPHHTISGPSLVRRRKYTKTGRNKSCT